MSVVALPPADDAPLRERLRTLLAERFRRLESAAKRCRDGGDDEAVHDLRVAARRLESALDVWRDALAARPRRRARALAQRLRRRAGRAREMEVNAALLARLARESGPGERPVLEAIEREMAMPLAQARAQVARRAGAERLARLGRRLERAAEPDTLAQAQRVSLSAGRARLERRRRQALEQLVDARPTLDDALLHAARIAVKKWRYAEESFAAVAGTEPSPSEGLRELQRGLGDVHDGAALRDLLLERADAHRRHGRGAEAAALGGLAAAIEARRRAAVVRLRESGTASLEG
jgi:CHAD domain-containing protein